MPQRTAQATRRPVAPPPTPAPHDAGAMVGPDVQMQIEAARAYPRSTADCLAEIINLATTDMETAAGCTYAVPRRKRQPDGSWKTVIITGPSVPIRRDRRLRLAQHAHRRQDGPRQRRQHHRPRHRLGTSSATTSSRSRWTATSSRKPASATRRTAF